ncbi:hypothetical protein [Xanthomonas axonopodis]|nr:hypothetical protein [Xanthomonas axonopodis]
MWLFSATILRGIESTAKVVLRRRFFGMHRGHAEMKKERQFTVGQVKAMLADMDAEFPPLTGEQVDANKASEKRRVADRKKREGVGILRAEVETLKKRGMSLRRIADVLQGNHLDEATPTLRKHMQEAREPT